jgi:hypothetical protein
MPFSASALSALTSANGFTLWHYRTDDDRATVLAPGYFAAATALLRPGDIVIVQASDATALVPIRGGTVAGGGVTLEGSGTAPALRRSATLLAEVMVTASAIARAIVLDPLPGIIVVGETLAVSATITGPIGQITFVLADANGSDAAPPETVPVIAGRAAASIATTVTGSGFRIRAFEPADPTLFTLSPPIVVAPPPRLLTEAGGRLLLENGAALLL